LVSHLQSIWSILNPVAHGATYLRLYLVF
jgi:hypothetical protein